MGVDWSARRKQLASERVKVDPRPVGFILYDTPSLNDFNGKHWAVYHRLRKEWDTKVFGAAWKSGWRKDWGYFKHVRFIFIRSRMDKDNAIGGLKPICDAMRDWGMIEDDAPGKCRIEYFFQPGERKQVEVRLTPND